MNINRHNYEELFLLYVDNELTAAERTMVENFISSNPDLKEELELLKQTSFTTDIKLEAAFLQSLLKPVAEETTISEEQLLLFVDDELNAHEAEEVRKLIAVSSSLQKEVELLQRSKLVADASIVFPNKSVLYKEESPARVFYMSAVVRRWSAAAAVILLLGSGVWLLMNSKKTATPVVKNNPFKIIQQPAKKETKELKTPAPFANEMVVQQQTNIIKPTAIPVKQNNTPAPTTVKRNDVLLVNNENKNQLPIPEQKTNLQETIAIVEPIVTKPEINSAVESNKITISTVPIIINTTKPQASYAAYNNNDESGEEDHSLLNEQRQRSSGLKGFLKKAKRTIERRTGIQSGDSQVRFAVFAVNTQ